MLRYTTDDTIKEQEITENPSNIFVSLSWNKICGYCDLFDEISGIFKTLRENIPTIDLW